MFRGKQKRYLGADIEEEKEDKKMRKRIESRKLNFVFRLCGKLFHFYGENIKV